MVILILLVALVAFFSMGFALPSGIRILYYSRHFGTLEDFKYFSKRALQGEPDHVNPASYYTPFGLNLEVLPYFIGQHRENFTRYLRTYDIIFICDTIPDSLPFLFLKKEDQERIRLQSNTLPSLDVPLSEEPVYKAKIVLQVTNRFDFGVDFAHLEAYRKFMASTVDILDVHWIVNNPFEIKYMASRNVVLPDRTTIVRPFGFSDLPAPQSSPSKEHCVYINRTPFDQRIVTNKVRSTYLRGVGDHYGGPLNLALTKCLVYFPYQVSVMKMFENFYAGVITAIPSRAFLQSLLDNYPQLLGDVREGMKVGAKEFVEFYNPKYNHFFIQFNDWEELETLLDMPSDEFATHFNTASLREDMMVFAKAEREESYRTMWLFINSVLPGGSMAA